MKNGVKKIQAAAYNGARTVVYIYMYVEVHQLTYDLGQLWAGHMASYVRLYNVFGNAWVAKQQYTTVEDG